MIPKNTTTEEYIKTDWVKQDHKTAASDYDGKHMLEDRQTRTIIE